MCSYDVEGTLSPAVHQPNTGTVSTSNMFPVLSGCESCNIYSKSILYSYYTSVQVNEKLNGLVVLLLCSRLTVRASVTQSCTASPPINRRADGTGCFPAHQSDIHPESSWSYFNILEEQTSCCLLLFSPCEQQHQQKSCFQTFSVASMHRSTGGSTDSSRETKSKDTNSAELFISSPETVWVV